MTKAFHEIPGPVGHWFWGHLRERRRNPLTLYMDGFRKFGPLVRYRMGSFRVLLVNDAELAHKLLLNSNEALRKGKPYDVLRILFGNGLLTSEGAFWKKQRKLMQPAFHRQSLELSLRAMTKCVDRRNQELRETLQHATSAKEQVLDLRDEIMRLTQEIP